jgi:SAM-dependent methyltransferase
MVVTTTREKKWKNYIHTMRRKEVEIIFEKYPEKYFSSALELGAGDGFQSKLLDRYAKRLISTDLDPNRLNQHDQDGIQYKICDAELIDTYFVEETFDLIFASNLFEHLSNPSDTLTRIRKIVGADGVVILIMPSPFWALCRWLLYYPVKIARFRKKQIKEIRGNAIRKKGTKMNCCLSRGNNLKAAPLKRHPILDKIRWPIPHGVSNGLFEEFMNFRKKRWCKLFNKSGFKLICIKKGPVMSSYGLGLDKIRLLLERIGLTGEYIYALTPFMI